MVREDIQIQMTAGITDAVIYRPEGDGQWPGVLYLTDIGGIRPAYHETAQRLAGEGYVVLMPNVFYRTAKPPVLPRNPSDSEEDFRKRFTKLTSPLTPEAVESDAAIYVDALEGLRGVRSGSRLGVVGYCFTGAFALRVAAVRPGQIVAAASFHGGSLATEAPTSPHLLLPRIKARLYFGHAVNDRSMPEEAIRKLEAALKEWGGRYESEVYDGAYHSWTALDSPVYNPAQAERAFTKLTELLAATLR